MKKVVFLIHDLGQGGAEKVLVNLVNHMDRKRFSVSVIALFGGGINEQFLRPEVGYRRVFPREIPGNSRLMKLLTPAQLYRLCIREEYDIVVSYLEGPSARIVSGYPSRRKRSNFFSMWSSKAAVPHESTKLVSWIHVEQHGMKQAAASFRGPREARACYNRFDRIICVSQTVAEDFSAILHPAVPMEVLYNTVESDRILEQSREPIGEMDLAEGELRLIAVGSLKPVKGFDRLLRVHRRLRDAGIPVHTYILGRGPEEGALRGLAESLGVADSVTLLGYHTNPYQFVARADVFVCSSFAEGFSTAATEALIVGTPVCTVEVSGMREMLGEHNEYGIITENSEDGLFAGLRELLESPEKLSHYRRMAAERGRRFNTGETVAAVEEMLEGLFTAAQQGAQPACSRCPHEQNRADTEDCGLPETSPPRALTRVDGISLVVPVYNMASLLPRSMGTLLNQTAKNYEIILVDDGSTDESLALCQGYAEAYPELVRVIHQENSGLSSARNAGMAAARGTHVSFPDPDDWVEADYVEKALLLLQETPELACLGHFVAYEDKEIAVGGGEETRRLDTEEAQAALMARDGIGGFAWNKFYRLDLIRKHGLRFEEDTGTVEDLDFAYRYLAHCREMSFAPQYRVYHYYQRPGAATSSGFSRKKVDCISTYEKILADTKSERIARMAREEICNWAINLTVMYLQAGTRDDASWRRIRQSLRRYLPQYLRSRRYGPGRKLQGLLALACPRGYVRLKR